MNKLEQIIGRGVRRCSHRLLPEEKKCNRVFTFIDSYIRCVKESIDLHTYRIAENKAKQMGEVELILKENAVDCLVHKGQITFILIRKSSS